MCMLQLAADRPGAAITNEEYCSVARLVVRQTHRRRPPLYTCLRHVAFDVTKPETFAG